MLTNQSYSPTRRGVRGTELIIAGHSMGGVLWKGHAVFWVTMRSWSLRDKLRRGWSRHWGEGLGGGWCVGTAGVDVNPSWVPFPLHVCDVLCWQLELHIHHVGANFKVNIYWGAPRQEVTDLHQEQNTETYNRVALMHAANTETVIEHNKHHLFKWSMILHSCGCLVDYNRYDDRAFVKHTMHSCCNTQWNGNKYFIVNI